MIKSFNCRDTERLFDDEVSRRFQAIERVGRRKLLYLHAAKKLSDLQAPPGNCLQALRGKRRGQHSIRVNDQWRICFVWKDGNARHVEIVDYH